VSEEEEGRLSESVKVLVQGEGELLREAREKIRRAKGNERNKQRKITG
jgi:hypothetical protein